MKRQVHGIGPHHRTSRRWRAANMPVLPDTALALDEAVRLAAMAFLRAEALHTGGPVSWDRLREFTYGGQRIPLVNQTGI